MDKIYFRKHLLFSIFSQVRWTKSSHLMLCWCEGADHQDAWWAPMLGGGTADSSILVDRLSWQNLVGVAKGQMFGFTELAV